MTGDEAGQRTNLRKETHLVHLEEQQQCQVNTSTTTNRVPGSEAGQQTNLCEQTHLVHLEEQQQCLSQHTNYNKWSAGR